MQTYLPEGLSGFIPEGLAAFRAYESAAAEEHAVARELTQSTKVEVVYHLLAADLFNRISAARTKTLAAFKLVETFKPR
jgi:hypothetical protein